MRSESSPPRSLTTPPAQGATARLSGRCDRDQDARLGFAVTISRSGAEPT